MPLPAAVSARTTFICRVPANLLARDRYYQHLFTMLASLKADYFHAVFGKQCSLWNAVSFSQSGLHWSRCQAVVVMECMALGHRHEAGRAGSAGRAGLPGATKLLWSPSVFLPYNGLELIAIRSDRQGDKLLLHVDSGKS